MTNLDSILKSRDMEKEMATHSSILAWKSPWTEEPDRLQSMGLQRVRKTIALTRQIFVGKVMSLLFNMLSRLVIAFIPRSEHLLISRLIFIP